MKFVVVLYIGISVVLFPFRIYGQEKRAMRLFERRNYDKLEIVLDKIIRKDSLSPGAYFIRSLYYSETINPAFNIDSAYKYVNISIRQLQSADEDVITKLHKAGIDSSAIIRQRSAIELLAFNKAKTDNSVEGYNYFIEHYKNPDLIKDAVMLRDKAAFENAARENTYEAYLDFVKKYPEARQIPEAQKRYDLLIYREFTRDGKLESYERFAYSFPTSAHWNEAVTNIFRLSTVANDPESYQSFLESFPEAEISPVAAGYLYLTAQDTAWFRNKTGYDLPYFDSLLYLMALDRKTVVPVFENERYGFMDQAGNLIIAPVYNGIDPGYFCGEITDNYFIVWTDSIKSIICRNGKTIYSESFYTAENLGYGFLRLSKNSKYGIIHESGYPVLPFEFNDVGLIGKHFIKAKKGQQWALYTLTGIKLTGELYDNVEEDGNFILLEKAGKIALSDVADIAGIPGGGVFQPDFEYDDAISIDDDHILCTVGEEECILDRDFYYTIPLANQHIYSYRNGWIVSRDSSYDLFDLNFVKLSGSGLRDLSYKGDWMTARVDGKWILYFNYAPVPDEFLFDSVSILNDDFVWFKNGNREGIITSDFSKIDLNNYTGFRLMQKAQHSPDDNFPAYIILDRKNREQDILDPDGKICFSEKTDNLRSIGNNYFLFLKNNKYGLLNINGKQVLKPVYDGIADYHDGFVTIFSEKKFGIANPDNNILIDPDFTASPAPLNKRFFLVRKNNRIGLLDLSGNILLDTIGDQIKIWNDTSVLIHAGDHWDICTIPGNKILYSGLISAKELCENQDGKYYLVENQDGFGILNNNKGLIINITFTDILNIGKEGDPLFFAEKYIPEADFYIVIYYNSRGQVLRKQVYSSQEYSMIYCH